METAVSKVYAALPGSIDEIVKRTGLERKRVSKTLHNMISRRQIRRTGSRGDSRWSVRKAGPTPKFVRHKEPAKPKRTYKRRKAKTPGILLYLEALETRIKKLEDVIGV